VGPEGRAAVRAEAPEDPSRVELGVEDWAAAGQEGGWAADWAAEEEDWAEDLEAAGADWAEDSVGEEEEEEDLAAATLSKRTPAS
jgi:hypothetical protein